MIIRRTRISGAGAALLATFAVLLGACGGPASPPAALAPAAGAPPAEEEKLLNVYNWSDYIDPAVVPAFEKEYGIKVNYDVFDSNEVVETKLLAGKTGYDVVVPSASFMQRQIVAGVFQKLDKAQLPNLRNLDPDITRRIEVYDPGGQYGVNYLWGTSGIGYNAEQIAKAMPGAPVDSFAMLFDPQVVRNFQHCGVSILDAPDEVVGTVLVYLGRNPNSEALADLQAAEQVLLAIRPYVRYINSSKYIEDLANGEICLALGWSGDIGQARARARCGRQCHDPLQHREAGRDHVLRHARDPCRRDTRPECAPVHQLPVASRCRGQELRHRALRHWQRRGLSADRPRGPCRSQHLSGARADGPPVRQPSALAGLHARAEPGLDALQDRSMTAASTGPPATGQDSDAYVRLENVSKHFGEFVAVNRVSLSIAAGEIFCLLGASGCGKTTLLRLLAGFETPTEGRLLIDGEDLAQVPPYERPVNMMFQSYALFPHLTVERNVAFGLEQERLPGAQIRRRVGEMLEIVKMTPYARRKPHQLSGGQRQRVALARALVKRPKLLLLDEPLGALDRKLREHTQFELLNIQQQLGVTFVVVTHDQEEAMTLATRIGVMERGEIVQIGTPRQIYEFPASRYVADFVGSVNLFEGTLIEDEPDYVRVRCPELPVPVLIDHGISAPPNAALWVAVRPEKITLQQLAAGGSDNWARGVIREIAYLGDWSVFLVRLESGREVRATLANQSRKAEENFQRDMQVYLSWDASSPVVGTD